ncbi:MAG: energy transducer TonB [Flavobacteriaceae bacterium]
MNPKKSPNKDLRKSSGLFFAIGLCLMLFVSWRMLEWKTYDRSNYDFTVIDVTEIEELEIPITEQIKTPPPPPPKVVAKTFEVVENEEEIEETIIESTETTQDEIIEDVEVIEEEIFIDDVPFAIIEDVPVFPGCENVPKSQRKACFEENINKFIKTNFRYPEIAQEMGIQGRVNVAFVIDQHGNVTSIQSRGPDKNLIEEAERIIGLLPKMTPGKQRGRPVRVPYGIPITFKLQ